MEAKEKQAEDLDEMLQGLDRYAAHQAVDLRKGIGGLQGSTGWPGWQMRPSECWYRMKCGRGFVARADQAANQWKAVKPHPAATEAQLLMSVIVRLAQRVRMETGSPDISGVMAEVERLLEESVDATPFVIDDETVTRVDLIEIDFDALAALFESGKKATAASRLQTSARNTGSRDWCGPTRSESTTPRSSAK